MSKKLIFLDSMVNVLNLKVCKTYSIRSAMKVSLFGDFVLAVFLLVACSLLTATPVAYGGEGYALEVNGGTVTIDDDEDALRLSSYTYELWMKDLEGPTGSWRNVFCKGPGDTAAGRGPLLALRPDEPGLHYDHSTGTGQSTINTLEGIPLNEWIHIALVLTDLNGQQIIYQDGVQAAVRDSSGLTDATQSPVLRIGLGANVVLDDFRVWNYARTEAEIQADMNREVSGGEEGLVGYWRFNEGEGTTAFDTSPYGNHGTITAAIWTTEAAPIAPPVVASSPNPADSELSEDTWVSLSWRAGDGAASQDVYFGEDRNDVEEGAGDTFRGNQTTTFFVVGFPGFPYPDGLTPGTTYYWRIDGVEADGTTKHKGEVWSFTVPPRSAYLPDPPDGAQSVDSDPVLGWTPGFGSKLHYVYFGDNFEDVNNAAGALPLGTTEYAPGTLKMAKTYYWRVDEFDILSTHKGDVWSFTTEGAVESLDPANGAVGITQTPVLTWTPGVFGASHEVYFGTDADAVKNADTSSPEYKGSGNLGSESFEPGQLEWNTTYYWRVDEANNTNADSPWTGPLWSFATANFLIIDDFESYNDLDPADPASNRIFFAWLDGYDDPANGSLVGYDVPPFAEQTIVHSGNQSMPFAYDNGVGKSEATYVLTSNRDWTVKGVNSLTIWYRGDSANAAENLYVALNGSAVVNHDNPDAAQRASWTEWKIDLQAFADQGVNLANVTSITLGLGNRNNPVAGGAGMIYFDDIRLYAPAP
jgi:hypothetical protein